MSDTTMTPLGALWRGLIAGAVGSAAQSLFFAATKKIAPSGSSSSFQPPEPEQESEQATETVARRAVEGLMQRELPIEKAMAGQAVHYAFGAGWGALYGLGAASAPSLASPLGGAGFGLVVWAMSDDLLLPAFKLADWPRRYPMKSHAYAIAAHLVYGAATFLTFEGLRPRADRRRELEEEAGRSLEGNSTMDDTADESLLEDAATVAPPR